MSAPKVTTKSGRKAIVRVAREFPYPTEFNAPEPPPPSTTSGLGSTVRSAARKFRQPGCRYSFDPDCVRDEKSWRDPGS